MNLSLLFLFDFFCEIVVERESQEHDKSKMPLEFLLWYVYPEQGFKNQTGLASPTSSTENWPLIWSGFGKKPKIA